MMMTNMTLIDVQNLFNSWSLYKLGLALAKAAQLQRDPATRDVGNVLYRQILFAMSPQFDKNRTAD